MPRLFVILATVCMLSLASMASAQSLVTRYVAGEDYQVVEDAPMPGQDGPVHVTEFFMYTCPHCYHFESELASWVADHPDIDFERVPVLFGQAGQVYARLYYTEQALGVTDRLHEQIFAAIHEDGRPLATQQAQRAFMVAHGVDGQRFDAVYDSEEIDDKIQQVAERMRHFRVTAVPSIAVGDRFWVSGRSAGSNERMLDVVDYLIARARDEGAFD